ncbi:hypothetical protein FOA52_011050 [Chlamydomonas sp. UWO 241]|nr:hypothetical protein FOA52_011050 [Chlamydomonas sp. UWO 241]
MDTRPWRLSLPPAVTWYEVDRADVLRAKKKALRRAGASFEAGKVKAKHPLAAAEWSGVALDLQEPGWSAALLAAGFSPSKPTVWVLEGLLYYLEPEAVPAMLKEAASVSAPGSALVASIVDAEFVERLKASEAYKDKESLMSGWKWGCPTAPGRFFGECGWSVLSNPTWVEAAGVYGLSPDTSMPRRKSASASAGGATAVAPVESSTSGAAAPPSTERPTGSVRFVTAVLATR